MCGYLYLRNSDVTGETESPGCVREVAVSEHGVRSTMAV